MRAAAAALVVAAVAWAGCAGPGGPGDGGDECGGDVRIQHVHGLAYANATRSLYVATHHGVLRGVEGAACWRWEAVGEDRSDFMGFTMDPHAAGPTFYASGHPTTGGNAGLRRSTDGGLSWQTRSLGGQADFHALTALHDEPGHVAGWWSGRLMVSRDGGATWTERSHATPIAALAASEGTLWAGTPQGVRRTTDFDYWQPVHGPHQGLVTSLAASPDGSFLLAGTGDGQRGTTYRSLDGGRTWGELDHALLRGAVSPVQFAIDAAQTDRAFAATAAGDVLASADRGATWTLLREG